MKIESKDLSVSMIAANLYSLLIVVPACLLSIGLYLFIWGYAQLVMATQAIPNMWVYAGVVFVVGIFAHELLHGLSWKFFGGKNWSSIKFGFQLKTLTPYAHCTEPMNAHAYRMGAAAPGVVLGLTPASLGIIMGWPNLFLFGLLFTVAAGGDALILWLLRGVPRSSHVEDHPTRAGCLVLAAPDN